MVWYGMVWCGVVHVVWCGVVWYGIVWHGMAWHGTYGMVKRYFMRAQLERSQISYVTTRCSILQYYLATICP